MNVYVEARVLVLLVVGVGLAMFFAGYLTRRVVEWGLGPVEGAPIDHVHPVTLARPVTLEESDRIAAPVVKPRRAPGPARHRVDNGRTYDLALLRPYVLPRFVDAPEGEHD